MRDRKNSIGRMFGRAAAILVATAAAGLDISSGATWSAVNAGLPSSSLGVSALAIDPNAPSTVYAQSVTSAPGPTFAPGLFKTTDGGGSWTAVSSILSATILAIDPKSSTLYAGVDQGVLKSTNGGASWTDAGNGLPKGSISRLVVDPLTSTVYVIVYTVSSGFIPTATPPSSLIFKSTDAGASWNALDAGIPAGAFINTLVIDPMNSATLYLLVPPFGPPVNGGPPSGLLLKSTDGGASWSQLSLGLPPGPPSAFPTALVIDRSSTLYAVVPQFPGPAASGGILKSADGGNTWKALPPLPTNTAFGNLLVDPADPSTLYIAGSIFTPPSPGPTPPSPPKFVVVKTTDGGQHWNVYDPNLPPNTSLGSLAIDPVDTSKLYAGFVGFPSFFPGASGPTPAGGVLRSTDGGKTWSDASAGLVSFDIRALAISPTGSSPLFSGGAGGVFSSPDGGTTWNATALTDFTGSLLADSLNLYAQTGRPNGCDSDERLLLRSSDGGASWNGSISPLNSGCVLSATFVSTHPAPLVTSPADPNTLYLGESDDQDGYSAILKSTDGGASWSAVWDWFTGLRAGVRALAVDPARTATIYAGLDDASGQTGTPSSGLFKSTDGGLTWTNTGLTRSAVSLLAIDPSNSSIVYAAVEGHNSDPKGFQGVFKSTNGGATWQPAGKGLDTVTGTRLTTVTALRIDPANSSFLYLGTSNGGVFRSGDGGATWSAFNDGLANLQIRALTVARGSPRTVYAGTPGGVFKVLDP